MSCKVAGNEARGKVFFRIPGLYCGKIAYKGRRVKGAWVIQEFALPHYHRKTVRTAKGVWKIQTTPKKGNDP